MQTEKTKILKQTLTYSQYLFREKKLNKLLLSSSQFSAHILLMTHKATHKLFVIVI